MRPGSMLSWRNKVSVQADNELSEHFDRQYGTAQVEKTEGTEVTCRSRQGPGGTEDATPRAGLDRGGIILENTDEKGDGLKRELRPHFLNMIAFSGSVGTGLIIGSGASLHDGGPASLVSAFTILGFVVWSVITALGEMATECPMKKGFAGYCTRFVDAALGFATGWNYFLKYVILLPTNLTASGLIIQYWNPHLNVGIWVTIILVVMIPLNLLHVSFYGKAQYILGWTKIVVLAMMVLASICISFGGSPNHDRIAFRYWKQEPFRELPYQTGNVGRFLGFWSSMVQACFAYTGAEIVGASFGETPDPQRNIPKAIRLTGLRILLCYILAVVAISMSVSPTSDKLLAAIGGSKKDGGASPFVIAVIDAHIKVLPHVFNACLLFFTLSAVNADIYTGARTLHSLAHDGQAFAWFKKTTENGVPWRAVLVSSAFGALAYLNAKKGTTADVFQCLVSVTTVLGALNWINILLGYFGFLRAMKAQGRSRATLKYKAFGQPYISYISFVIISLIILFNGYRAFLGPGGFQIGVFVTCYAGIVLYLFNIALWKWLKKTKRIDPMTASLDSKDEAGKNLVQVLPTSERTDESSLGSDDNKATTLVVEAQAEKTSGEGLVDTQQVQQPESNVQRDGS